MIPKRGRTHDIHRRALQGEDMVKIGYFLSSEEFRPNELIEQAKMAESAGFEALWISDHFHPWTSEQGNSPFVWSVIGGLSQATSLPVTTGVTCPTMRTHPAIVAQAAATSAVMLGDASPSGWVRREPQRAHPRGPLATHRGTLGDARRGHRDHAPPVGRGRQGPLRQTLHRGERPALHVAGRAAPGTDLRLRAEVHPTRRAHRRRLLRRGARPRRGGALPLLGRRGQTCPHRHKSVLYGR